MWRLVNVFARNAATFQRLHISKRTLTRPMLMICNVLDVFLKDHGSFWINWLKVRLLLLFIVFICLNQANICGFHRQLLLRGWRRLRRAQITRVLDVNLGSGHHVNRLEAISRIGLQLEHFLTLREPNCALRRHLSYRMMILLITDRGANGTVSPLTVATCGMQSTAMSRLTTIICRTLLCPKATRRGHLRSHSSLTLRLIILPSVNLCVLWVTVLCRLHCSGYIHKLLMLHTIARCRSPDYIFARERHLDLLRRHCLLVTWHFDPLDLYF